MKTELTPAQLTFLDCIANSLSIDEAVKEIGIDRNTVTNWRRTIPAFNQELEEAIEDRALVNRERIQALVYDAIGVLRSILQNEKASPSIRLRAAQTVFKMTAANQQQPESAETGTPAATNSEIVHNSAQQPVRVPSGPARNSNCPCGSRLKFKRCCANRSPQTAPVAA